ncbi:hypothetical protein HRI_004481400 [Hibiscus trionum]|uniref:Uncharacterized protein n=1 Tax=Hibiscus trionum TaxID=183268 RepID=A0A9W7J4Z3_HIBTR|nr:hypothetical protein HRI_004481400 [Hibiscus trionum]
MHEEALHGEEELAAACLMSFSGRVFRSPTLFEDMVKCFLLCNCQFSRTLSYVSFSLKSNTKFLAQRLLNTISFLKHLLGKS